MYVLYIYLPYITHNLFAIYISDNIQYTIYQRFMIIWVVVVGVVDGWIPPWLTVLVSVVTLLLVSFVVGDNVVMVSGELILPVSNAIGLHVMVIAL